MKKQTLLDVCKAHLGTDASPNDVAPDELACADTVTTLVGKVDASMPHMVSTIRLNEWLRNPKNGYQVVETPQPEDIIVSPTVGERIGHTGIFLEDGVIASNDSGIVRPENKGKFLQNYTLSTWVARYQNKLGLSVIIYRRL